jgi:hypothetical protein
VPPRIKRKAPESAALERQAAVVGNRRLVACCRWSESLPRSVRRSKSLVHDSPTCEEFVERIVAEAHEIIDGRLAQISSVAIACSGSNGRRRGRLQP